MCHIGNTRCTFLCWQNGPHKKETHESRSVSTCINVRLLSWPIFVQCVSKPPRFCFSWWILVTETAQGNFPAAQSLAFGARINLGFCPSCATTQVDTMQLHYQIHKFTSQGNSSPWHFRSSILSRGAPKNGFPTHADAVRMPAIRPHEDLFASNYHEWKQKTTRIAVVVILSLNFCRRFRPSPTLDRTQSLQFAVRVQVERPWRIRCSLTKTLRTICPRNILPSNKQKCPKPWNKNTEKSNSTTTQSRSMIISGRNMGATLAFAISLRVPPASWAHNSNRLNMQNGGWFSDGSLKLLQFEATWCSATKSWNGDAGNRNCGLTTQFFSVMFCSWFWDPLVRSSGGIPKHFATTPVCTTTISMASMQHHMDRYPKAGVMTLWKNWSSEVAGVWIRFPSWYFAEKQTPACIDLKQVGGKRRQETHTTIFVVQGVCKRLEI